VDSILYHRRVVKPHIDELSKLRRDELRRLAKEEGLKVIGVKKHRIASNIARHRVLRIRIGLKAVFEEYSWFLKFEQNPRVLKFIPKQLKTQEMCDKAVKYNIQLLKYVPEQFRTQEMCNKAIGKNPWTLELVPEQFKTQEMYNKVVGKYPWALELVPEQFKTQKMCSEAVEFSIQFLKYVPDHLKTEEMCNKAIEQNRQLYDIPDWILTSKMLKKCGDAIKKGYNRRKAQKTQIKEELMPIAWHPNRAWDWCFDEEQKCDAEKLWS